MHHELQPNGGLQFNNLQLDCTYDGPPVSRLPDWHCPNVDWIAIDGRVIAEYSRLLSHPYMESVTYKRCSTTVPIGAVLTSAVEITLDEVHDPVVLFSLLASKPETCCSVTFLNCDGLCGEVLRCLAKPIHRSAHGQERAEIWLCPGIRYIHIVGCTKFSSAELRTLLKARRTVHEETGWMDEFDPEFIVWLVRGVHVIDGSELDPDDKVWLDVNVPSVTWNGWRGGDSRA
ncbi:hypothetical protein DAEQUDRAFT_764729 [Daedalea quercina L-15889]|uniref:F-box domain-containing protein n=1 Tax=Daedalea quercina L-15889 TaxID=1314783 RepID=A0A165R3V6_9APHY|nr:hypothetical protein DAEQUDRAFT_764729 [Daedalea quercina L-15889]